MKSRSIASIYLFIFSASIILSSCVTNNSTIYDELLSFADEIPIVNTHEHQRSIDTWPIEKYNFWFLVSKAYLSADIVSAGGGYFDEKTVNEKSLDEMWESHGEFLNKCKNTSYYKHFLKGLQLCYGYSENEFSKEGIEQLSEQIAKKYSNYPSWFDACFAKFNFETMLLDQYWANHNSEINKSYFSFVLQTNSLTGNIGPAKLIYTETNDEILKLKDLSGIDAVNTLDDYLKFANALVVDAKENGAVALKNSQAYWRTLNYKRISFERANELFEKSPEISNDEEKELQDFMFHWFCDKGAELHLPLQIHTGYLAGNGNQLYNSNPLDLNDLFLAHKNTKFDLFHGGFPWTGEWIAMAKMFPNVYLNLVWLPQISKERALVTFKEMLDCVPYNKFLWGGDCHLIEETVGSLQFGKEVVCKVLAEKISEGELNIESAKEIISAVFYDNAVELFNLN